MIQACINVFMIQIVRNKKEEMNSYCQKRSGFTLIELLVVMAILGLLATVGLNSFRSSQIKGRDAQRKQDLGHLQRALEAYYNDKGQYPLTAALPASGAEWRDPDVAGGQGSLYIKAIPADPKSHDYSYESSTGSSYKILVHLENQNDQDIETCSVVTGSSCVIGDCNYGVSSANLDICD